VYAEYPRHVNSPVGTFRSVRRDSLAMARYRPSDYVPHEVLVRPDFIDACKRRDLGAILDIASKWSGAGFSPSHIARRCEMTVSQVQAYTKHGRNAMSVEVFERVSDGLHIPGKMLGMDDRPWEDRKPAVSHQPSAPANADSPHGELDPGYVSGPDEDVDILLMIQEADRSDIGPGTVESIYTVFDKLCRDYPSVAASDLQRKLKVLYRRIMALRQGRMTFAQHRELLALSGWVTALLACVDWDLNQRDAAETARAATLRFAKEIGHGELTAWSYEMQAWFALTEGRYSDVTSIAKAAQTIGGENSAIVQLIMQEARGWAKLGNVKAAESAIDKGHHLLQRLPAIHYPRHFIYDRTKFPFYVASCYQWLGDFDKAETFALRVIDECKTNGTTGRSPMRLAEVHITIGLVHVNRNDLDAALASGFQALSYERKSGPSLLIRAAELNNAIARKFPGDRRAAELDEKVKDLCDGFGIWPPGD
jgi:tetratricopeptide (TPR) repeat protein